MQRKKSFLFCSYLAMHQDERLSNMPLTHSLLYIWIWYHSPKGFVRPECESWKGVIIPFGIKPTLLFLTEHFKTLRLKIWRLLGFVYVVRKHRLTDLKALKSWCVRLVFYGRLRFGGKTPLEKKMFETKNKLWKVYLWWCNIGELTHNNITAAMRHEAAGVML